MQSGRMHHRACFRGFIHQRLGTWFGYNLTQLSRTKKKKEHQERQPEIT